MTQLKKQKQDSANRAGFTLKHKLSDFLDVQTKRMAGALSFFDGQISTVNPQTKQKETLKSHQQFNEHIDAAKKLQMDAVLTMDMEKDFSTVDSLTDVNTKMLTVISDQKHIQIQRKYDECKEVSVRVDKQQKCMQFQIEVGDLDRSREDPIILANKEHGYTLTVALNEHNPDAFDLFLRTTNDNISDGDKSRSKVCIVPRVHLKPVTNSNVVMGNLE